jgi:hypothetical protein
MIYQQWLESGLSKPGKNDRELAKRLKLHPSAIYKMIVGDRRILADELPTIAEYIEEPIPGAADATKPSQRHGKNKRSKAEYEALVARIVRKVLKEL